MISIKGLDDGAVLAALYNASQPLGMGFLHFDPKPMSAQEAWEIIYASETAADGTIYFDYLKGRVMKVRLGGPMLDPRLYDRDNGPGAAARAIEAVRG